VVLVAPRYEAAMRRQEASQAPGGNAGSVLEVTGDDVCGVLLAGGKSSRMGRDKSTIEWRGEALWRRQLRVIKNVGINEVVIAGERDGPWRFDCGAWKVVEDAECGDGPLSGLLSAFEAMRGQWVVSLAVDMPLMTTAFLSEILAHARASGRGCVPIWEDKPEPLAAVYPRSMGALARHHLERNQCSLHQWVWDGKNRSLLELREIRVSERVLFSNVNTPSDLSAAALATNLEIAQE
jgi:molybdopterin-guanine dinucleotide biosynthesis protein A